VHFEIGPVPSRLARIWLDNSADIVAAARRHRYEMSVSVEDPLLDLAEAYLAFWRAAAEQGDEFHWTYEADTDQIRQLAEQWIQLGLLTEDDLALLGCHWAPEEAKPFYDALLAGTVAALRADPETLDLADLLSKAPPGTRH